MFDMELGLTAGLVSKALDVKMRWSPNQKSSRYPYSEV